MQTNANTQTHVLKMLRVSAKLLQNCFLFKYEKQFGNAPFTVVEKCQINLNSCKQD